MSQPTLLNRKRVQILGVLAVFLASIYMITYSGRIESGDTLFLFNATGSLVHFSDNVLDLSAWAIPPDLEVPDGDNPLPKILVEPLQLVLAAPIYWLADKLPDIGLVHTVWLFNVLICTATCCLLFLFALALGYGERTAVIGALLLGLCTIVWPYSKTFFREPLAMLMNLLTALFAERWRTSVYRSRWMLVGLVASLVGAFLAKEAVIFALPALLILLLPERTVSPWMKWTLRGIAGSMFALVGVVGFLGAIRSIIRLRNITEPLGEITGTSWQFINTILTAFHSYLWSVGGSVWSTSPVVLLALPGCWLMVRQGKRRYVWVVGVMLFTFAAGYALFRGVHWFGGLSWPPRFLIPIVPFLIIGTLPAIDWIFERSSRRWVIGLFGLLVIYSIWIQLTAVTLPWEAYTTGLPVEGTVPGEWGGGLNFFQYVRWVIIPTLWGRVPLDFAWDRTGEITWLVMFATLSLVSGIMLIYRIRAASSEVQAKRWTVWASFVLPIVFIGMSWGGLRSISDDDLYSGKNESLHDLIPILRAEIRPDDVLLLSNNDYTPFFLNYGKTNQLRIVSLPDQPGEQPSPEQPAQVRANNPDALLERSSIPLIFRLAAQHDRLWLLVDASQWIPWRVRPVEQFMNRHYYPIRELSTDPPDPTVRLVEYSTVNAPDPYGFMLPEYETDLTFGGDLRLMGYTLPQGQTYKPGDALPLSFVWQADAPLERDYTVAWFLADANGAVVAQGMDSQPGGGFAPTSSWQVGAPMWDNRALRLPDSLQAGRYHLWVRLYPADDPGQPLSVTGSEVVENSIGVLPVEINVLADFSS